MTEHKSDGRIRKRIWIGVPVVLALVAGYLGPWVAEAWAACAATELSDMLGYLAGAYTLIGTIALGALTLYQNLVFQEASRRAARLPYRPVFSVRPALDPGSGSLQVEIRNAARNAALELWVGELSVECGGEAICCADVVQEACVSLGAGDTILVTVLPEGGRMPDHVRFYIRCVSQAKEKCTFVAEGSPQSPQLPVYTLLSD